MGTDARAECLVLAQYYFPERIGSAPYCTELAEWLADNGAPVRVVTCRPHYPRVDDFPGYEDGSRDREQINKVDVLRVPSRQRSGSGAFARLRCDLDFVGGVTKLILQRKARRAETVVAFIPSIFSLVAARLLCRPGGRIIAVVHDIESGLAKGLGLVNRPRIVALMEAVERLLLNGAHAVIVLTPHMEHALREIGVKTPVTVLPIWAREEVSAAPVELEGKQLTIMYSGNFGRKQGLHQLIDCAERLQADHPEVTLLMQGDGTERRTLEEEAARRGLKNVQFRGLVPRSELMDSLRSADIHLVPQDSRAANYALPSKITSVMAAGRPFVCTADPGSALADITQASDAGVCVRPDDPAAFHAAVVQLIQSAELRSRLGENGRRYVFEQLNARAILRQYERLILNSAVSEGSIADGLQPTT